MAGESLSPNMNLILPGVGVTLGPLWATDLNNSLTSIDGHDHTTGNGVPITPGGLNMSSDLPMLNNNITQLKSLQLQVQLSVVADLRSLYSVGSDLYFTDGAGNNIQITDNGGVAGTPGSIANLVSPASASYVSASSKFLWQSDTNVPAIMDSGYLILRNINTNGFGITLTPPSLSSNYTITLPSLPASQKIMTLDNSGNLAAPYTVDNSTIEISSNIIRVKDSGIVTAKIADTAVTEPKMADDSVDTRAIVDGAVTTAKLGALGQQTSSTCGNFSTSSSTPIDVTNLNITITTTGRPVMLFLQPDGSSAGDITAVTNGLPSGSSGTLRVLRDATTVAISNIQYTIASNISAVSFPPSSFQQFDAPAAGTYTYKVQASATQGALAVRNCILVAYEI